MSLKSALREPLVHFLALGALLFVYSEWRGGGSGPGSTRIAITPGVVEHLASGFARTWQRPPTDAELKGLIDEHVKEEIAAREATALGLDRDDTIIRRRLRQKLEFLVEDELGASPPTDAELQVWLERHTEALRIEPKLSLRQVFVSPERRGASARADAGRLLARLQVDGSGADIDGLGDSTLLPPELPIGPASEVARTFGSVFAARLEAVPTGRWTGPVESTYGLHLVVVPERVPAAQPTLAEVRPIVEREFLAERRKAQLQALYERLLAKYIVTIEMPRDGRAAAPAAAKGGTK